MSSLNVVVFIAIFCNVQAIPVVLKGSSPSGNAVVAISSNDPAVLQYISSKFPKSMNQRVISNGNPRVTINQRTVSNRNPGVIRKSFSIASPGQAAAGTGRSFVSTSAFNPFLSPLFFNPLNFEGIGLGNFEPMNLFKGFESFPEASFSGPGAISAVSAVNDNGRVYGNVKTIRYNSRPKNN